MCCLYDPGRSIDRRGQLVCPNCSVVERRIGEIDVVLFRHAVLGKPQAFAESLEMNDLSLPQKFNDVIHVRIVAETENIVIGDAGLLFWCDFAGTTST